MSLNREGKTYKHKKSGAIIVVIASKRMSAGTARHTVLVLDEGVGSLRVAGEQVDIEEIPVNKWERNWEEV